MIRTLSAVAIVLCAALPLRAETVPAEPQAEAEEGFSLIEELGPVLRDLAAMMGDIRNYHAPEMLPNGDIIIRRKTPDEQALPEPGEDIEI